MGVEDDLPGGEGGDLGRVWKTCCCEEGGRQGRWYNEGNESFMVAVWLPLVQVVFFFFSKTQEKKNFFTKINNKCVL